MNCSNGFVGEEGFFRVLCVAEKPKELYSYLGAKCILQATSRILSAGYAKSSPTAIRATTALVSNEEALGAITDFIYNLGASRYKNSTLRRRLNEQDWDEAQLEIGRWVRAGGRVLPGLVRRRSAEAEFLPKS